MSAPTVNSGHTTQTSTAEKHGVTTPTHSEGDLIFIFAGIDEGAGAVTMTKPTGFSVAYENMHCYGSHVRASLWYIVASASEPSSYLWTSSATEESLSIAWSVSGHDGIDLTSGSSTGNGSTVTCLSVTTTVANTLVLRLIHTDQDTLSHELESGYTWIDSYASSGVATLSVQHIAQATAGSTGNATLTLGVTDEWGGRTVAIKPGITPDPPQNYHKIEQLTEQSTTSTTFIDISNTTLTFTPNDTSEIWMIFASGVCRSSATVEESFEMRLLIGGVEEDLWSHQNLDATSPNGGGFLVFDRITGTVSEQTVKLQFRAISGTCYADNLRIVAARVPDNADFQFYQSDGITATTGANVTIGTMSFTPSSSGNYYIIGSVKHREYPGGTTSEAWFEGADSVLHPDAATGTHHSCARDPWNPATYIWRENLAASLQTFNIRFTSSNAGVDQSEHRYRKFMAFREDAWDDADYSLSAGLSTSTSGTFATKNSVTTATPPEEREYISFQTARISGASTAGTVRKSGELRIGGSTMVQTNHRISRDGTATQGYHHTIGLADVRSESGAVTYDNGFLSPDAISVECAESAIVVLRYASTGGQTHQMML